MAPDSHAAGVRAHPQEKEETRRQRELLRAKLALDKAERLAKLAAERGVSVEELGGSTDLRTTIVEGAKANPRVRRGRSIT